MKSLIVQKYGGATLADPQKIKQVAERISDLHKTGAGVVVIVSAMGNTTNELIALAHQVSKRPLLRELDMLLTTGERVSMSLLSMALNDLGCPAISFTGSQAGILTDDSHVNANILEVKAFRIEEALKENKVVILAGFQGVSHKTKEITTLGRGGSDITAVAIADYLKADRCEILKDVDCVYTADPKVVPIARPIHRLSYRHLLEMTSWGAKVLHHRSVHLAAEKKVTLYVGSAADGKKQGTTVTHDYSKTSEYPIAINSFSAVFEADLKEMTVAQFQNFLQKNQIGQIQPLHHSDSRIYFTAAHETLKAILDFIPSQQSCSLINSELSSVSAVFCRTTSQADLQNFSRHLKEQNIELKCSFCLNESLHFIVSSEFKNKAIQNLHQLIED